MKYPEQELIQSLCSMKGEQGSLVRQLGRQRIQRDQSPEAGVRGHMSPAERGCLGGVRAEGEEGSTAPASLHLEDAAVPLIVPGLSSDLKRHRLPGLSICR